MTTAPELDDWITRIKSSDSTIFEDTYEGPRPTGPAVIPRLISEMHAATDGYTRGKFIELLGEMGDASVVSHLVAELAHADQKVRDWAAASLQLIGGEAANQAVERYKLDPPDAAV